MDHVDRRTEPRVEISSQKPFSLLYKRTRKIIPIELIDVSANGIGGTSAREISAGSELVLQIGTSEVEMVSLWTRFDAQRKLFKLGLVAVEKNKYDIASLLTDAAS